MGEDPGRIRAGIEHTRDEYASDPEADRIRADIEETRANMAETAHALGHKANVPARVKESVSSTISGVGSKVAGGADAVVSRVTGAVPDTDQVKSGAARIGVSRQNPLGLAVAGAAVGFVVGTLLPSTTVENERLGETADQVKDAVREAGGEAVERGKQVAQEAVDAAKETAREGTQEQSQEVASSLQDRVREAAPSTGT